MRRRNVYRGLALLAAVSLPITLSELLPLTASATTPDQVLFTQTSGSSKAYFKYVPGGNTSNATTQNVTGGGGCSNPTLGPATTGKTQGSTAPILGWAANVWSSQNSYTAGGATAAIVGAYNGSTGVCALGQNFSIDNVPQPSSGNSKWGVEELDFTSGTNPVDANRPFKEAQINIANNTAKATMVHLVETLNGTQVADQYCKLGATTKSNSPAIVVADTTPDGTTCTGTDASFMQFDTVKIQVPTNAGDSVSVVQTSTFTLGGGTICGGQTVPATSQQGTSGQVSANLTLDAPGSDCKTYANFAVSDDNVDPNAPSGYTRAVLFSGTGQNLPSGDSMTTTVDWGDFPACDPTTCPVTWVTFDGTTYVPQKFCSAAPYDADTPWCTVSKTFTDVDVNGTTMTHITETWSGVGDPTLRGPG